MHESVVYSGATLYCGSQWCGVKISHSVGGDSPGGLGHLQARDHNSVSSMGPCPLLYLSEGHEEILSTCRGHLDILAV